MMAAVWIPPAGFASVVTVVAAGHMREVRLSVRDLLRGRGPIYSVDLTTEVTPEGDLP